MNQKTKTYEGMFLLEAGTPNFETACEPIRKVLDRNQAEILSIKPWDERKLAYEVRHHKRGLYVLTYFRTDPLRIAELEHDCQLNEQILRVLILHRDHLSDEQISADTPAMIAQRRAAQAAERQAAAKAKAEAEQPPAD
ncbi:MAG: 30S ribosomal protein S6, partial [Phycisphaerae bacterium]|nr:30S ribosomal protein S6 [Phycisphaerae bacterium]